jgi:ABC-type multidrug transport system fused ATPase/permease subunit
VKKLEKFIGYYIHTYKKQWFLLSICVFLTSLFPSFIPLINKILIDKVFLNQRFDLFRTIIIVFVFLMIITTFANYYRHKSVQLLSEKIKVDLSSHLYSSVMRQKLPYFEKQETGRILALFQSDIPQILRIYKELIPSGIQILFQVIFSSLVLLYVSKIALLLVLIFLPISIFVSNWYKKKIRLSSCDYQEALETVNTNLHDHLMGAREILLHTKEKENILEMTSKFRLSLQPTKNLSNDLGMSNGINFFIYWCSFIVVLIVGGILTSKEAITLGSLIAMLSYFMSLFGPLNFLIELFNSLQSTFGAQQRLSKYFRNMHEEVSDENIKSIPIDSIEFKDVSYKYEENQNILENISFLLRKGDFVSIIGESGVGKTTLINLILKNLLSTTGQVNVNHIPIDEWDQKSLLQRISFVSQDYYLFNKSIKENIKFANESINDEEITLLAKKIGANSFISNLKGQYSYRLGYNGNNLSGGQKQRIALIRALAKNFDVLILDEGTSSLDPSSADKVINTLKELRNTNKIIIYITHDLELAKKADLLFELKKGSLHQYRSTHEAIANI